MAEEEDIKREKEKKLTKFRITVCEAQKADAERKWKAAEKKLLLEQENLQRLEAEEEDELWAKAFEDGKRPNYEVEKQEDA